MGSSGAVGDCNWLRNLCVNEESLAREIDFDTRLGTKRESGEGAKSKDSSYLYTVLLPFLFDHHHTNTYQRNIRTKWIAPFTLMTLMDTTAIPFILGDDENPVNSYVPDSKEDFSVFASLVFIQGSSLSSPLIFVLVWYLAFLTSLFFLVFTASSSVSAKEARENKKHKP